MRARRRVRERHRPAARARKARQQPFGHLPDDLRVNDLRPPRLHGLRAVQGRLAGTAFRRRIRGLPLVRVRIPQQAFSLMTGLAAALAVLAALPLGLLPRLPCLFRPDPLLRAGRARVRAVHRQPPLQLRDPQLQPASRSRDAAASAAAVPSLASATSRLAVSTAICSSFAPITARSRATRSPCSPPAPGSSDTSRKHAQPVLKVQSPAHVGVPRQDPVNGHQFGAAGRGL